MATIKHQAINTLKKGDYFKLYTEEKPHPYGGFTPERVSKSVYVYDGYNRYGKCWNYHHFEDVNNDLHTKNKNILVTTDFEF